jgi:hypothetical protein
VPSSLTGGFGQAYELPLTCGQSRVAQANYQVSLQTFVILPTEKTTVWVKQNVNFFNKMAQ